MKNFLNKTNTTKLILESDSSLWDDSNKSKIWSLAVEKSIVKDRRRTYKKSDLAIFYICDIDLWRSISPQPMIRFLWFWACWNRLIEKNPILVSILLYLLCLKNFSILKILIRSNCWCRSSIYTKLVLLIWYKFFFKIFFRT